MAQQLGAKELGKNQGKHRTLLASFAVSMIVSNIKALSQTSATFENYWNVDCVSTVLQSEVIWHENHLLCNAAMLCTCYVLSLRYDVTVYSIHLYNINLNILTINPGKASASSHDSMLGPHWGDRMQLHERPSHSRKTARNSSSHLTYNQKRSWLATNWVV